MAGGECSSRPQGTATLKLISARRRMRRRKSLLFWLGARRYALGRAMRDGLGHP